MTSRRQLGPQTPPTAQFTINIGSPTQLVELGGRFLQPPAIAEEIDLLGAQLHIAGWPLDQRAARLHRHSEGLTFNGRRADTIGRYHSDPALIPAWKLIHIYGYGQRCRA